jgi:hypothetical protein
VTTQSSILLTIHFPDIGCSVGNVPVTPLGHNMYRLEEAVPMSDCTTIYDVIKAKRIDADTIRFVRVVEKSNWRTYSYSLQQRHTDSPDLDIALAKIGENGAKWDQLFGGLLFVYVPPESDYNPDTDVQSVVNKS